MPTYSAFCKAPLVNPSYVPLSPAAVHPEGMLADCIAALPQPEAADARLLAALMADEAAPECPDLSAPVEADALEDTLALLHAALPVIALQKDKERMVQLLARMREIGALLPALPEERIAPLGADCLRLCAELYRRTGQRFLLAMMAELRSQLPDFAGFFHSFPFVKPFVPGDAPEDATDGNAAYERRMALLATGRYAAEGLAVTALLAQYSGSGREAAAAKAGLAALWRYHGLPIGSYSADPTLAGRDPAEGADLPTLCALAEAYADLLCAQGDPHVADRLETLLFAGLRAALRACQAGERPTQQPNALRAAPAAEGSAPESARLLARALYAVRRSLWLASADDALCLMLPLDSTCVARVAGAPVRLRVSGGYPDADEVRITVECRKQTRFTLQARIPAYALGATACLEGEKPEEAPAGELYQLTRNFRDGDTLVLRLPRAPRMETGYRNALSVYLGNVLMALPVTADAPWQVALSRHIAWEASDGAGRLRALATAIPQWAERQGRVPPPPQGLAEQADTPVELVPYAETDARVSAFPQVGLA